MTMFPFGYQNPYGNPELNTYFAGKPITAFNPSVNLFAPSRNMMGNLPPSAAQPGTGPAGNTVGSDSDPYEPGFQGPGDPVNKPPKTEVPQTEVPGDPKQRGQGGNKEMIDEFTKRFFDHLDRTSDSDFLRRQLEATEPYFLRVAQRNQEMGLQNLEAAGKAAFKYKYAPQMAMTAAASKAAYYPEMVRAASESFTGLNLAEAAKPRMSGYYRGLI